MALTIQQLQQQRQSLEQQRRQLMSERSTRQVRDINQLRQRQIQLQQVSQAEQLTGQQLAELQAQQSQVQESAPSRSALKQSAIAYLVSRGRANDAYNALSPKEQEEVRDQANNIQASGARSAGNAAVSEAEKALSFSLTPELRRQIYLQGASGARLIQLPTLGIQPPNQFM